MSTGSTLILALIVLPVITFDDVEHCEPLSPEVKKELCTFKNNMTHVQFPNFLGMETQQEAIGSLKGYELLLTSQQHCSSSLALFLCSTYLPICYPESKDVIIKPCRAECEMSRFNCSSLLVHYSYPWPEILSCDRFEWYSNESETFCIGDPKYTKEVFAAEFPKVWSGIMNGTYHDYGIDEDDGEMERPNPSIFSYNYSNCESIGLIDVDHTFNEYNCALPCHSRFYGPQGNLNLLKIWSLIWAALCCISTLFTVMTFVFDQQRFRYPERAIIFSAVCYFFISVGFILGFFKGDDIVCENGGVSGRPVIRQGDSEDAHICFLQFFLIYYFMLASFLWWVILNLTWFLAAGLKWGHEAIAQKSGYFHAIAWILPAVLFTAICLTKEIDGDRQANICFVGNFKTSSLQYYVIAPLSTFYIFGISLLGLGMFSMYNVRHELHHTGKKTDKLETLMIRIGMFSVLYSIPATLLVVCFLIENSHRTQWEINYVSVCLKHGNCLKNGATDFEPDSDLLIFNLIKYLMMLVTGLSTGFWVLLSFKTASNWAKLLQKLRCCGKDAETAV